ncbi:hypothetical protein BGZ73_001473, partial [Actinomortierella ambigua]
MDERRHIPTIESFFFFNDVAGQKHQSIPVSPIGHGFMTFTELELGQFFCKEPSLLKSLNSLIGRHPDDHKEFKLADLCAWLPGQAPGHLIKHFVSPIASTDGLTSRKKGKAGHAGAIKQLTLDEIEGHINQLRDPSFQPCLYDEKGYVLHGSVKTDGFRVQLLAFKMKELQSVRYRRYKQDLLPDPLASTIGGTDRYLTEIRNVVQTENDVMKIWDCRADQAGDITYLGIDPGQNCVVGACALLPNHKQPKGHRRKKRRKNRKPRRGGRGSGKGKKAIAESNTVGNKREDSARYLNLAVKQKA